MNKLTTVLALALFISASAFANSGKKSGPEEETKTTAKVKTAFKIKFNDAENVNWNKEEDFYFANFKFQGNDMSAAYDESGNLLGISRKITLSQLSLAAQQALQERFEGYTISNAGTEILFDGQTSYYFTAENNAKILKFKSSANGEITIEKTTRKKKLVGTVY